MAQTKKAPISARKPIKTATTTRKAAVKMPVARPKFDLNTPRPARIPGIGKARGRAIPITNHIPIGIAAPRTAVERTKIMVTVSFNVPVSEDQSVVVTGCWSGTSVVVAGPITIVVLTGSSNGSGQITAPALSGAPNDQLILTADFNSILMTASVTILPKPATS